MNPTPFVLGPIARGFAALVLLLVLTEPADAAGPFTVNTTGDTHAVAASSSPNDSGGHVSLRSAIEAANAQSGATTINLPAGAYNLTLGELAIALNGGKTNTIIGAGASTTFVTQTDGTNRVFNVDSNSLGNTFVMFSGITIQGGHDGADKLGGAGVLAGSVTSLNKDRLILSNCVVQDNHCLTNTTQQPGGGIQMAGGDLILTGCAFSNNTSGQSFGGAVFVLAQSVVSSLNATNSTFLNNSATNTTNIGPDGGGAILIMTTNTSVHSLVGCTFSGNRVIGTNTYGGALQINGGILNIVNSTFVANTATGLGGQGGLGGALYVDSGTVNLSFCRLAGNSATYGGGAVYNHGSNLANTTATNNWWGCNGGPGAGGCDVVSSDGGTMSFNPWIIITNSASPGTIGRGQSTTLTASVLRNSSNQILTSGQVPVLIGLPLTWNGALFGSLSAAQTTIQANGQATATFTNDGTCNNGSANVTLDSGTTSATVIVQCPDLTVTKTDNVGGTTPLGNSWTWTIHLANAGPVQATFTNGSTILLDNLPTTSVGYGPPSIANASGITGSLVPSIDASANLTIAASGTVTLNPGASFDALLTATPIAMGTCANPRTGGICSVDPNNAVPEANEGNNSAADSVVVTCPAITGTVGGGGSICAGSGGSAFITVTLSGGTPPYTVTLNNGGGTKAGNGPLFFAVSPVMTTTYQVSSGTDSLGCPVSNSGSATVTLTSLASPALSLSPASVFANSGGNQASGPGGFAGYAWTISNGIITSATNQPTITYVAGVSDSVTLGLTVANASGCTASGTASAPIITGFSIHTNVTITDALTFTSMGMAFDGTNYWSCSGGSTTGVRLARYTSSGALAGTYSPGLDFRSVFVRADGTLLARAYNSNVIFQQTSPGVFAASGTTLTGGILNTQSSVVLGAAGTEYQAMSGGVVSRWSTNGAYLGSVALTGFGSLSGENTSPQNRGLGVSGNLWLTYNGNGILSIWDSNGNREAQAALPGAGTSSDSSWGFSFCNGKVFIVDAAGGKWRGYDLYSAAATAVYGSPSTLSWNTDVQNKILGTTLIPQVDAILVTGTNPVPTLAELRRYAAVLVYSDSSFNNNTNLGNVLADYVDQGGGVALATFAFWNSLGLSIQGRLATGGYLPFTTAGQTGGTNLTLAKDLPAHPLLDGVVSFDGGSSSFHNGPITIAPSATLVAHWSDGQPLVGAKDSVPGRCAGLNFYPPSSDAGGGLWLASTDGARLMADALLWSGRIPPTILAAPADQVRALGSTATFIVSARGVSPLSYQWRLNGTNLPLATSNTLSFLVQNSSPGTYSVVVSNLYGATTSLGATLNPQLRFLSPSPSGGAFSLLLVNADGSAVATNRAARVHIYSTTNLAVPFLNWSLLANPVVPSNGQLRVDGLTFTNSRGQFFRAAEAP